MDATKWTQGFLEMMNINQMEQILIPNTNTSSNARPTNAALTSNSISAPGTTVSGVSNNNNNTAVVVERKARPQEKLNCPRCNSTNTKFCYYNNYSLTQPRYFCKGCRRYWTEGGSRRNVPVGGSSRKNKRSSSSSSSSNILQMTPSSLGLTTTLPDLNPPILFSNQISNISKGTSQDLNYFSFPVMQDQHHHHVHMSEIHQMAKMERNGNITHQQPSSSSSLYGPMMDSNTVLHTSLGFPTTVDYKPNYPSISNDHQGLGHNKNIRSEARNHDHYQGRVLFPSGDQMKELSSSITHEVDHDGKQEEKSHANNNNNLNPNNGYWSGMFSTTGGSSW